MNCGTCKHWRKTEYETLMYSDNDMPLYVDEDNGDYRSVHAPGEWGECTLVAEFGPRRGSDRFYVKDASTYSASLYVRSDFGCLEHAAA